VLTSSTRGSTGPDWKKWQAEHTTRIRVAAAIFMMGCLTCSTPAPRRICDELVEFGEDLAFTVSSSMIASMTSWRSDRSARLVVNLSLPSAAVRSRSVICDAHAALERLGDASLACGGQRLGGLVDEDVDAGPGRHFCDSGAHLSRADHAYSFDWIAHFKDSL